MDKKFYSTNTSMLNLYAKCLYQKVSDAGLTVGQTPSGQKYVRLPHGKVPMMADDVICEDMYGISHYFNQGSVQTSFHVDIGRFDACSDEVGGNYTMNPSASYPLYPLLMK